MTYGIAFFIIYWAGYLAGHYKGSLSALPPKPEPPQSAEKQRRAARQKAAAESERFASSHQHQPGIGRNDSGGGC